MALERYLLDLNDSEHGVLDHVLQQYSFLWVYDLIVAIFKSVVGVYIEDIELAVVHEPLLVIPLVLYVLGI
jgi:hypothetical protein